MKLKKKSTMLLVFLSGMFFIAGGYRAMASGDSVSTGSQEAYTYSEKSNTTTDAELEVGIEGITKAEEIPPASSTTVIGGGIEDLAPGNKPVQTGDTEQHLLLYITMLFLGAGSFAVLLHKRGQRED